MSRKTALSSVTPPVLVTWWPPSTLLLIPQFQTRLFAKSTFFRLALPLMVSQMPLPWVIPGFVCFCDGGKAL